jgi:hypothetical protein
MEHRTEASQIDSQILFQVYILHTKEKEEEDKEEEEDK